MNNYHKKQNRSYGRVRDFRKKRGNRGRFNNKKRGQKYIDPSKYVYTTTEELTKQNYSPSFNYKDLQVNFKLKQNILNKGYNQPTEIQDRSIPHILNEKDILGIANTGTGKTAAFLIPLINKSINNKQLKTLIIVPTRELAAQVEKEFISLKQGTGLNSVLCIGGNNINVQIKNLRRGFNFIVGTPGRLQDLEKRKVLNFAHFNNIVLDEVDRMLDMGFVDEIKYIIGKLPSNKQSLFFSATIDKKSEEIANTLLKNPVTVKVKSPSPLLLVDQKVVNVKSTGEKPEVLYNLLVKEHLTKVLVFCRTKRFCDTLTKRLVEQGIKAQAIHGDKSQYVRTNTLKNFKEGKIDVLVATDVAARGIDVKDISHVINYDEPDSYDDYIHRVGRTGRAGKKGNAITFVVT